MPQQYEELFIPVDRYVCPPWIDNNGEYMVENHVSPGSGRHRILNPDAFDCAAPNAMRRGRRMLVGDSTFPDPGDLENLLFVEPQAVEQFLERLEQAAEQAEETGKQVLAMVSTGGTIAMSLNEHGELIPTLSPQQLLEASGKQAQEGLIPVSMELMRIDSSQYEYAYTGDLTIILYYIWTQASERLKKFLLGWIVPHGTDTCTESAMNLMIQLGPGNPMNEIFVAANRDLSKTPNDVGDNIYNACAALKRLKKANVHTVSIVGGGSEGGILGPAFSRKNTDRERRIFTSPYAPAIIETRDFMQRQINHDVLLQTENEEPFVPLIIDGYSNVETVYARPGVKPGKVIKQIRTAIEEGVRAIVLVTYGGFTVNEKIRRVLQEARDKHGILLVATNPFPLGSHKHRYKSSIALRNMGAATTTMSPHATELLLNLALRIYGKDEEAIKIFLERYDYVGAIPPDSEDDLDLEEEASDDEEIYIPAVPGPSPALREHLRIAAAKLLAA